MERKFEIRTYGFNELAMLYFPNITKSSASKMLGQWIGASEVLVRQLSDASWKKRSKYFTPKQVRILINHLDPPY